MSNLANRHGAKLPQPEEDPDVATFRSARAHAAAATPAREPPTLSPSPQATTLQSYPSEMAQTLIVD